MHDDNLMGHSLKRFQLPPQEYPEHTASGAGPKAERPPAPDGHTLSSQAMEVARKLQTSTISPRVLVGSVRLFDLSIIALVGSATLSASLAASPVTPLLPVATLITALLLAAAVFQAADCYQVPIMRSALPQAGRIIIAWSLVIGVVLIFDSVSKLASTLPESWLGLWYALTLASLLLFRLVLSLVTRQWTRTGRLERRAVIVGGGETAADLIHEIEAQPTCDIRICGIFDDRSNERSPTNVAGYPKLGTVADLVHFGRIARIDMLIVTIPLRAEKRLLEFLQKLWVLPVDIRLSAHTDKMRFRERASCFIGTVPFVDVIDRPVADWDAISKRAFDIVVASLLIAVLAPVMLAVAVAIRLESKGPALFRQNRYGFNNEVIEVLKFRSMHHDMADPAARKAVTKNDPRVTRIGRIIRKTSLDELPQLFNVLRGELSLVGPRPHAVNAHTDERLWEQVVDGYFARHKVRPGVTGWAQINGWRGEVDIPAKIQKRVEYDIYYIENWSIFFDLMILLQTPFALFNTKNAY